MLLAATLVAARVHSADSSLAITTPWMVVWTCGGIALSRWICPWHASRTMSLLSWGVGALFACVWWPVATPAQLALLTGMVLLDAAWRGLGCGFVLPGKQPGLSSARILARGAAARSEAAVAPVDGSDTPKLPLSEPQPTEAPETGTVAAQDVEDAAAKGDEQLAVTGSFADERSEQTTQWFLRRVEDDLEVCEGELRVEFGAGIREVTLHVAFCPPLPTMPQVDFEDVDGRGWQVQASAVYPYGIRLSVRRSGRELAEECGRVAYWAQATRQSRPAA